MHGEKKVNGKTIRLVKQDITELDVDAFIYYAQHDLKLGSGFGNAIAARGGPGVQKELDELGSRQTGDIVVTSGGNLKAKFIIHAVGPRFQEAELEKKLHATTVAALKEADGKGAGTVALPPMGAGFYGVPLDVSAQVTLGAVREYLQSSNTGLSEVIVCVNDSPAVAPFKSRLEALN